MAVRRPIRMRGTGDLQIPRVVNIQSVRNRIDWLNGRPPLFFTLPTTSIIRTEVVEAVLNSTVPGIWFFDGDTNSDGSPVLQTTISIAYTTGRTYNYTVQGGDIAGTAATAPAPLSAANQVTPLYYDSNGHLTSMTEDDIRDTFFPTPIVDTMVAQTSIVSSGSSSANVFRDGSRVTRPPSGIPWFRNGAAVYPPVAQTGPDVLIRMVFATSDGNIRAFGTDQLDTILRSYLYENLNSTPFGFRIVLHTYGFSPNSDILDYNRLSNLINNFSVVPHSTTGIENRGTTWIFSNPVAVDLIGNRVGSGPAGLATRAETFRGYMTIYKK